MFKKIVIVPCSYVALAGLQNTRFRLFLQKNLTVLLACLSRDNRATEGQNLFMPID